MDNWEKIIKGYSKTSDNSTVKYIDAVVTRVSSDFFTADVKLITGQVVYNLYNKTGEKLYVNQGVMIGYRTSPTTAGWIALANGEPDPIRKGGGWDVATATILDNSNFDNFTIDAEEMAEISPATKLYYGATNRFIIVQGMLCYYAPYQSSSSISAPTVLPPRYNGSEENFQAIINNWDMFSHSLYDMDNPANTLAVCGRDGGMRYCAFSLNTYEVSMNYNSSTGEYIRQRLAIYSSVWRYTNTDYRNTLKFYSDLTAEEKATVTQTYQKTATSTIYNVYKNGSQNLSNLAQTHALIPIVSSINYNTTTGTGFYVPYGSVNLVGFAAIADGEWCGSTMSSWGSIAGTVIANPQIPFKNQAEKDFSLALTQRSEPQEDDT